MPGRRSGRNGETINTSKRLEGWRACRQRKKASVRTATSAPAPRSPDLSAPPPQVAAMEAEVEEKQAQLEQLVLEREALRVGPHSVSTVHA
jgi:hypothetical protein